MAKIATLKKQKHLSAFDIPVGKLKNGIKTSPHKVTAKLKSTKRVAAALAECLLEGDAEAFKEVLSAHIKLVGNKKDFSKKSGIGRATLYESLSAKGNPSLETIARIVHSLAA